MYEFLGSGLGNQVLTPPAEQPFREEFFGRGDGGGVVQVAGT